MGKRIGLVAWTLLVFAGGCGRPSAPRATAPAPVEPFPVRLEWLKTKGHAALRTGGPLPERPEATAFVPREATDPDPVVWTFEPPFFRILFDDAAQLLYDASENGIAEGRTIRTRGGVACYAESRRTFSNAVGVCLNCNMDVKGVDGELLTPLCFVGTPQGISWVQGLPVDFVQLEEVLRAPPTIPTSRAAYEREEASVPLRWIGKPVGRGAYCVERRGTVGDDPLSERLCFDDHRGLYAQTIVTPTVKASMTFRSRTPNSSCAE